MNKFVFLDRDGVINKDPGLFRKDYVTDWKDFHFLPGAREAIKKLTDEGYKIAVISNQAGIGKGVYTQEKLDEITAKMLNGIESRGGRIYSVQYCVHRSDENCDCRKPRTGLFKRATEGVKVDFSGSYFIGDTEKDMAAGKNIGCRTILVLSGKTKGGQEADSWPVKPDLIKNDLMEAAEEIKNELRKNQIP